MTAWIPFQTVTGDMGPMTVLDGSHRWEGNDRLEFFHEPDLTAIEQRIARGVGVGGDGDGDGDGDGLQPVPLELKLGQVSFHHCRTIHGSQRNTSDRPRIALAVHMQDQANRCVGPGHPRQAAGAPERHALPPRRRRRPGLRRPGSMPGPLARGGSVNETAPAPAPDDGLREETAKALTEHWEELLDLDRIEPDDRLLELGGNSLIATMLANRIELAWGFRPSMEDLLTQSLDELTKACAAARAGGGTGSGG